MRDVSPLEKDLIIKIAKRAHSFWLKAKGEAPPIFELEMDTLAAHEHCPLRLSALLAARDSDFMHDVAGIRNHLDRGTGRLTDGFSPRFAERTTHNHHTG